MFFAYRRNRLKPIHETNPVTTMIRFHNLFRVRFAWLPVGLLALAQSTFGAAVSVEQFQIQDSAQPLVFRSGDR